MLRFIVSLISNFIFKQIVMWKLSFSFCVCALILKCGDKNFALMSDTGKRFSFGFMWLWVSIFRNSYLRQHLFSVFVEQIAEMTLNFMEVFLLAEEFWEFEIINVTILEFSLILFGDNWCFEFFKLFSKFWNTGVQGKNNVYHIVNKVQIKVPMNEF
jgi:hypothetical protein